MFFKDLWPAFVWAFIILILCTIPGNELPNLGFWNIDKVGHAGIFGILSCLLTYGFVKQKRFQSLKLKPFFISILFSSFYGASTEIIQGLFIYKRTAELNDFIADTLGSILFSWLFSKYGKRFLLEKKAN